MPMPDLVAIWDKVGLPGVIVFFAWRLCVWLGPNVASPIVKAIEEYLKDSATQQRLHSDRMAALDKHVVDNDKLTHDKLDGHTKLLEELREALAENTADAAEFRKSVADLLNRVQVFPLKDAS